ncbi:30S ribosomal protein S1 [Hippea maritima]|uniref:30S ribosomal protein S1 n=1 Tax=Hippea maritima (strain ATCC 700847 / DSM 10411 / MH2) TaxID=760142 RepID=F2LXQ3_HIPMA|nr:30S ribosomal protein S1 [Hippea maritima]AEA34294.1 RNA binding S1 domain protein [Hippea maritima DSM 10411]
MSNAEKDTQITPNYDDVFKNFGSGDIVKGKVIDVRGDDVFVDIGYKSEGIIKAREFMDDDGNLNVKVGDEIEAVFFNRTDPDGFEILSKAAADRIKGWNKVKQAYKEGKTIKGKINSVVNGGFTVKIDGFLAFLPGSQVELKPIKNYPSYVGKEFEFKVVNINESKRNAVLSRKVLLEEEERQRQQELWEKIKEGAILKGRVKNITDYGVFVDLGGVDGLVHITDMSYSRVSHPSELVNLDDEVEVKIIKIEENEGKKKIYLGMKQLSEDPWKNIEEKFSVGNMVKGKIVNIVDYGLFVEIDKGIEGLVHKSEISYDKYPPKFEETYKIGDEVDVKITNIDKENRRMSLSIKQTKPYPWDNIEENYKPGDIVEGVVTGIKDFGIFVKLQEGVEGLIHENDLSWDKEDKPQINLKDTIKAKVLNIDKEKERIALGLKQLTKDPWEDIDKKYSVGDEIEARVVSVKPFGAFVKIEKGVESLVPKSEFNNIQPQIDETVKIRIIRIDKDKKRLISSFINE